MDRQCKAKNKSGAPCSAQHFKDGWCRWHHPDLEAQRQSERSAGGRARSNEARAKKQVLVAGMDLRAVDAALCGALQAVLAGTIEPGVGSAAASIARAIIAVRTAGELEQRLADIERTLAMNRA